MRRLLVRVLSLVFLASCFAGSPMHAAEASPLRVATFQCDVTPPLGEAIYSSYQPLAKVEHPLLAKGIVLDDGRRRYVLCSVDWCELCNSTHTLFRRKMAEAAGTEITYAAVQTIHQHTAPLGDGDAFKLLDQTENAPPHLAPRFFEEAADRVGAAVKESLARLEPFDAVGIGQAKVEGVASSRRVPAEGGGIRVRWSSCRDPDLRAQPEGYIDPYLKTITLARGDKPLVRLHYYATHPQSFYGDPRASYDFPGMAREAVQEKEGVFQIYFNGCGGDVTAGKYNDGSPEARDALAAHLLAGMEASIASTRLEPATAIEWRTVPLLLPLRTDARHSPDAARKALANTQLAASTRIYRGAMWLAFSERIEEPIELSALRIGPARILHLPGESMVEFQLYAQRMMPDGFVAVAAYGDCGPGYICTEKAFEEGGYEPTDSLVAPQSESILKTAIRQLLGVE
ncbi:MAG: hypothetical protein ABIP48_15555 [Planctomycetota bacterium]